MTEYEYYGLNTGPGEDGPIWRFQDDFETGVYLRRDSVEPAVVSRSAVSGYKGYRLFDDYEVPLWARPGSEVVERRIEYTEGQLLRGRTRGSESLVEGEFESQNEDGVCVTLTKVLENHRDITVPAFHPGLSVVLNADTVEAVMPGEVTVNVTPDISEFEAAEQRAAFGPDLADNFYVPDTPRASVLAEASELVHGERNANYGTPTENFDRTAALWNAQLGHKLADGAEFTAQDVAMLMVQLKMARLVTSPDKRDHYVDAAGYLACGWECQKGA